MTGEREDGLPEDWEVLSRADARALAPPPGAKERVRLQVAVTLGLGATLGAGAASTAAVGGAAGAGGAAGQAPAAEGAIAAATKALLVKKVVVATLAAATAVTGGTAAYVEVRARHEESARRAAAVLHVATAPAPPAAPALPLQPAEEPTPAPVETPAPSILDTLGDERTLLDQARVAISRGRFSEAEVLLGRHAQAFPEGRLVEEREALHIRLLVREGHLGEAHRRAALFRQQHPRSIQLPVIDEALRGRR